MMETVVQELSTKMDAGLAVLLIVFTGIVMFYIGLMTPFIVCKTCAHYEQEPLPPPFASDCKNRNAAWYPQRGYSACPQYAEKPLSDDDYL